MTAVWPRMTQLRNACGAQGRLGSQRRSAALAEDQRQHCSLSSESSSEADEEDAPRPGLNGTAAGEVVVRRVPPQSFISEESLDEDLNETEENRNSLTARAGRVGRSHDRSSGRFSSDVCLSVSDGSYSDAEGGISPPSSVLVQRDASGSCCEPGAPPPQRSSSRTDARGKILQVSPVGDDVDDVDFSSELSAQSTSLGTAGDNGDSAEADDLSIEGVLQRKWEYLDAATDAEVWAKLSEQITRLQSDLEDYASHGFERPRGRAKLLRCEPPSFHFACSGCSSTAEARSHGSGAALSLRSLESSEPTRCNGGSGAATPRFEMQSVPNRQLMAAAAPKRRTQVLSSIAAQPPVPSVDASVRHCTPSFANARPSSQERGKTMAFSKERRASTPYGCRSSSVERPGHCAATRHVQRLSSTIKPCRQQRSTSPMQPQFVATKGASTASAGGVGSVGQQTFPAHRLASPHRICTPSSVSGHCGCAHLANPPRWSPAAHRQKGTSPVPWARHSQVMPAARTSLSPQPRYPGPVVYRSSSPRPVAPMVPVPCGMIVSSGIPLPVLHR
eukprot:TRINITY_DN50659_c0_g1_i3.p1 TRINITY_DN50659_c0_g1~~TRINITY_DN50659_c0_g1_i3.p1  ORF type:complete len:560 (-),score=66.98 TRINITY_DN50659_c0_g1_i3:243-1922(-)